MLCSARVDRHVLSPPNLSVGRWGAPRPKSEQRLKGGHRLLSTIVPKHELVQIDLELRTAHAVVGADQPLLEVADGPIGKGGTADFAPLRNSDRSGWMRATCLKPASERPAKLLRPSV